ncbi:hypothetical protein [Mycolicibacterium iranicum]|uniref:Polyketide cyclase n=1 Tax=Mycolicibacterium iranicum TaxID=912594 RepID=A0A178LYR5_MYCIR|nr:hypothetical protein [Mycolicibacterium iranicum]OAN39950.1 hypothetical protein A4X20_15980 [Mycolicibacterium iranicum]
MLNKTAMAVAVAGSLYAARRYFRDWGTTKGEAGEKLAGDDLLSPPVLQATEAVWIDAPAEEVWPWLVQMGQDRGGLYSFEVLEDLVGLRYHNVDTLHPEWQHLAVGDAVRLVPKGWLGLTEGVEMQVVEVVQPETIVLRTRKPQLPWDVVWSFHLVAQWEDRCRLLVRSRLALRRPGEVLLAEMAGPARALVTRGMLLGIKRRAESRSVAVVPKQPVDQ